MKRRTFLKVSAAGAATVAGGSYTSASAKNKPSRPNILLLFSDQHHADVMGCAGHSLANTPNIDRLVREGVGRSDSQRR